MDYTFLGKRIREERLRLNLTQEKLAEAVNISTAYLGQIERGERQVTLDKLINITNQLGVTVDFLLVDYVQPRDDHNLELLYQLYASLPEEEKGLAISIVKLLNTYKNS